jgi:hypothetical protein
MPRKSAEERGAAMYRARGTYAGPPSTLSQPGKRLWRSLITARPIDHWSPAMLLLLRHAVETSIAADRVSVALRKEADLADERAMKLTRALCSLNTNLTGLLTRMRLTPQSQHTRRETGFNNETGGLHPLLGGAAWRQGQKY